MIEVSLKTSFADGNNSCFLASELVGTSSWKKHLMKNVSLLGKVQAISEDEKKCGEMR